MTIHELTDTERENMLEALFRLLKITRRYPDRDELEREIIDYLGKKQPLTLATTDADGNPHVSVVDYVNDGLTLYVFSEGGEKFKNIAHNSRVAIGIGTSARTITSVRGLNIWGTADVLTDDTADFNRAFALFKPLLDDFEKKTGMPAAFPAGMARIIRITPHRMVYFHYRKGLAHACWERKEQGA
jgi:nitroimidazol reductase NimA-like FMN-containing flavoprotein (pyridoxamine 5'-phosphate oxidase superfamily)